MSIVITAVMGLLMYACIFHKESLFKPQLSAQKHIKQLFKMTPMINRVVAVSCVFARE